MATINGYTAEKMKEIADAAIDSVAVVGEDLIITHKDGSTTNAGHVRGFPGISDMELYDPVGVPKPYTFAALPTGYGWCDAQTEFDGATYPLLAGEYGTGPGCINGPSAAGMFRLPDLRGKFLVGLHAGITAFDTLHETGGSKDAVNVTHNHTADQPEHNHSADQPAHDHGGTTTTDGLHTHAADGDYGDRFAISHNDPQNQEIVGAGAGVGEIAYTDIDDSGSHFHSIPFSDPGITIGNSDPAITVSNSGVDGTDKNLPPYRVVNYIMRLA